MDELNKNRRKKGWYKIGNIFIDEHARNIGYTASVIYLCIKRYMDNKTRIAFPSEELIAQNLNMDRRTVQRAVKKLEDYGFIVKEKKIYKGRWPHNTYYFTQSENWLSQPCDKNVGDHVTKMLSPDDKKVKDQGNQSHINNTNNKNQNINI